MTALAPTMQSFFTDRLVRQRHASPQTVAAYRDTMRLLLAFAQARTGKPPSQLDLEQLDAELICAFLDHLEDDRGTAFAPATPGSPRSDPYIGSRRCATPSTQP